MANIRIEVQAAVDDAVAGLNRVDGALGEVGGVTKQAGLGLADLKAGLDMGMQAFNAVKGAVESVIDPVLAYSKNIRDLSSFTGTSAEESSRLVNVFDDMQINYTTLRTAARKFSDEGLQLNIKNLAELSDKYLSIQDPVKRSTFLTETFGARAGPELARLLEKGSAAIHDMAKEAEDLGLVMDGATVERMRRLELQMDQLEDRTLGLKVSLAEGLVPAVSDLAYFVEMGIAPVKLLTDAMFGTAEAAETLNGVTENSSAHWAEMASTHIPAVAEETRKLTGVNNSTAANYRAMYADIGAASAEAAAAIEAANKRAEASFKDLTLIIEGPVGDANDDYYAAQKDAGAVIAELIAEQEKLRKSHGQVVESTDDGTQSARNLIIAQADLQKSQENLIKAQEKLAEDPGDLGLLAAVARAETAVDTHATAVEEWGGRVAKAGEDYVINNNAALDAVGLKLEEAQAAYDANATAHEEATARIVFGMLEQKLAMDGYTQEEIAFLTDVGEAWGIYDTKTANTLRAVDAAIAEHGLNANAVVTSLGDNIRSLPTTHTTDIYVRTHYESYGAEPGPGAPVIVPSTPDQTGPPGGTW